MIQNFDKIEENFWSFEQREALKKALISYGFGRWEQIRLFSSQGETQFLRTKSIEDIKAHSISFLRCVSDNLNFHSFSLRIFLLSLIQDSE